MRLVIRHILLIDLQFLAPLFCGQIEANFPRALTESRYRNPFLEFGNCSAAFENTIGFAVKFCIWYMIFQNIRSHHDNLRSAEVTQNSRGRDRDGVRKTEISCDWRGISKIHSVQILDLGQTYVHTNFQLCHAECSQFWVATCNKVKKMQLLITPWGFQK